MEKNTKDKQENINSLSENQINNIIFGTLYKRKISIKDWLYTKVGFSILIVLIYLFVSNSLNGQNIAVILAISLWFYNREKTLAHEKEKTVWLIKYKKWIFQVLNEIEIKKRIGKSNFQEAETILEACREVKKSRMKVKKSRASR